MSFRPFLILLFVAVAVAGCGYDSHNDVEFPSKDATLSFSLSALRESAGSKMPFAEGTSIGGVVVANDLSGNFYRTLVVEDESGAVALRLALYDLAALYPVGYRVCVDAAGLVAEVRNGVVEVGWPADAWNSDEVRAIEGRHEVYERVTVVSPEREDVVPSALTVDEITLRHYGCFVALRGLTFLGDEEDEDVGTEYWRTDWGSTYYGSEADRLFVDELGRFVLVRTSRYADFAEQSIPRGRMSISGILYADRYKGADVPVLKIRDLSDVQRER